jgi:hypothetical protein
VRPSAGIAWSLSPLWVREAVPAQYVTTVPDGLAETFGHRYVFAPLDRTTLSVVTRLDLTFSSRLSVQVYAQPYLSAGDFGAPAELARPRGFDFLEYGRDLGAVSAADGGYEVSAGGGAAPFFVPDRDYNFRSLRGTAVLRWDWRRGSTLYLAWQQDRSDDAWVRREVNPARDTSRLLGAPADDFFVIKVNYWINP